MNKLFTFLGFTLLLLGTYFRENILLEINALIDLKEFDRSYAFWFIDFFKLLPHEELVYWKWGVTIFFSVLMPFISVLSIYTWFKNIEYCKLLVRVYLIAFGVVVSIACVGYLLNGFDKVYFVTRKILGIMQSPIPFFLFFLLQLNKKEDPTN